MKFSFTTVRSLLIITLITISNLLQAQLINVPNSVYGLGDPLGAGYTVSRSLAGAQTAVVQADYINPLNPAANAYLSSPVFDVAMQVRNYRYNSPAYSGTQQNTSIRHFALGFANGKRLGVSFGLTPYTRVEYALSESGTLPETGDYFNTYSGDGGVNRVNGNIAYEIFRDSLNSISVGLGSSYYFGFIERSSLIRISNARAFNSRTAENLLLGDFGVEAGIIYRRVLSKKLLLNLGGAFEYAGDVRTSRERNSLRFSGQYNGSNTNILDTVITSIDTGSTTLPTVMRAGLAFEWNKRWTFSFNYEMSNWSELAIFGQNQNLADRSMLAIGVEYWPDYRASNDLFEFMRYRAGVRYGQSHLMDAGNPVDEFGISLGLGIPMIKSGSMTSLNIGWEFVQRSFATTSLTESISRFNIGVIMTPNKFDRWFYRRKID